MTVDIYLHQGKRFLARWAGSRRVRSLGTLAGCMGLGFLLSAVGLRNRAMPLAMGLVSVMTGWRAVMAGLGSMGGYLLLWGPGGIQGVAWSGLSLTTSLLLGKSRLVRQSPLLMPAFSALWVAATGLAFLLQGYDTPTGIYLLRVALGWASCRFFGALNRKRKPIPAKSAGARLEMMADTLQQTRMLLRETAETPIDTGALLTRTRERACGGCPNRRACRVPENIPEELLHQPMTENTSLPFPCRKPGRMVLEIRRTQEQFRILKADRDRRREYREAVNQQYLFLSEFLREQAEALSRRRRATPIRFVPEVGSAARSREVENGDGFRHFSGPDGRYFLLLCDGMGTGLGAAEEGRTAMKLLHRMLAAGFPAEYALESFNSLLALRGRAGAVTVDLAELYLDTGAAVLYKWGAAPSCLIRAGRAEKIGTAGPPPGIHGRDIRETRDRLSLGQGETLIILSDGMDGEEVRRRAVAVNAAPAGETAARLLEAGAGRLDDATVAVVRLHPPGTLT